MTKNISLKPLTGLSKILGRPLEFTQTITFLQQIWSEQAIYCKNYYQNPKGLDALAIDSELA